jgi:hypothetical protein
MDFSSQLTWEVALEVAGFVAAFALGLAVHALVRRQPQSAAQPRKAKQQESFSVELSKPRRMQFIRFGEDAGRVEAQASSATPDRSGNVRLDRSEVVRLAREMIKAGTPNERIQRVLPVSEAELALLGRKPS